MPGGRPSKYRKDFHPADFIAQSRQGFTFAQIAFNWDIDRDTIKEWASKHKEFSAAIKRGRGMAEAWYRNLGRSAMLNSVKIGGEKVNVQLGWFVWMTKNMFKWSDRSQSSEDDGGGDDDPLDDMSDEELDKQ